MPLIPAPTRMSPGEGTAWVDRRTAVVPQGQELAGLAARFIADVAADTGLALEVVTADPGGGDPSGTITLALGVEGLEDLPAIAGVRADGVGDPDERYGLRIEPGGIRVWAPSPEGVFRGLTTLRQLMAVSGAGDGVTGLAAVEIADAPRYAWRGLSFDVVRTFHPPDTVRGVIDMLALYKLNVLHLHLTDDQGWRFKVPGWPELTGVGAAGATDDRPGGHFTPEDVAILVDYARERFVTIVPEIDMPGHTSAVFAAYPDMAPPLTAQQQKAVDAGMRAGTLGCGDGRTWRLVGDALVAAAEQFSTSAYLHIGGDEAWGMPDEDHAEFISRAVEHVRATGRLAVGWQEAARGDVGPAVVIQYWIDPVELDRMMAEYGDAALASEQAQIFLEAFSKSRHDIPAAVAKGAKILVSPFSYIYLDRPYADAPAEPAQQELTERLGQQAYAPISLQACAEWEPLEVTPTVTSDADIAGVEAAIWCETVTSREDLEFLLLPRLATVGQQAWSAPGRTSWAEHREALGAQPVIWAGRGWRWFAADTVDWHRPEG